MPIRKTVPITFEAPVAVRQAMKALAVRRGLTDKGIWLMAARELGVPVPDEAIQDGRAVRAAAPPRKARKPDAR
jgi:hypothetical protein